MKLAYPFKNQAGMELRDYVAARVLPTIILAFSGESVESATLTAFEYADAFLLARDGQLEEHDDADIL